MLAVILCVPSVTSAHAASYKTGIYKVATKESDLNVRTQPGSDFMKVGALSKGTLITVTLVSGSWGKVTYGSIHGWVSLEYCKYQGEAEKVEPKYDKNTQYGISAERLTWVVGCNQEKSKSSGLCTSSATGTLLRRRQAAEGKKVTFTFGDTRSSCGGNPIPDAQGRYQSCNFYYAPENGWIHTDEVTGEKTVYYTVKEESKTHVKNREYLADLLDKHPEGVCLYASYASGRRHAILISDYTRKSDGTIQFYAYDPANHGVRTRLEDTWMLTKFKSVGGYFNNVIAMWYIKGELVVDDSKFPNPWSEKETYAAKMTVAKKNTCAYAEPDENSEVMAELAKYSDVDVDFVYTDSEGNGWYITEEGYYISAGKLKLVEMELVSEGSDDDMDNAEGADDVSEDTEEAAEDVPEITSEETIDVPLGETPADNE